MNITVLTLFPEMVRPFFESSIMKRAVEKGIISYEIVDFRDFSEGNYNRVDDIPYGGGAGMVIQPGPLARALESVGAASKRVVFATPSGELFTQRKAEELSKESDLVFICGHYEGLDQRVIDLYVDDEISIGDYVLTSGETSSQVIIDAVFRLIDGVIASESLEDESFSSSLLEYPQYTRPARYCSSCVPDVLLSGHHSHISEWRDDRRLEKTMLVRPDLLTGASLSTRMRKKLIKIIDEKKEKDLKDGHYQGN